jgi:two-component system phosphate regulon response regulator PhoB
MSKILVVDDEPDISELISLHMMREGHECLCITNGLEVMPTALNEQPDLIVLDLMLPGLDGLSSFKRLRADSRTRSIPVIMLTAKTQTTDRINGLELGADDYLTKRRTKKVTHVSEVKTGEFLLDRKNMKFFFKGQPIDLTTTEFKLLAVLMENTAAVHTRAELLREVWGYSDDVATRTLDTHIKRLREKLGEAGKHVVTVRGTGYQFSMEAPAVAVAA